VCASIRSFNAFSLLQNVVLAMLKALKKIGKKMTPEKAGAAGGASSGHGDGWHLDDYNTDELIGKMYMFFEAQVLAQRKPIAKDLLAYRLELPLHSLPYTSRDHHHLFKLQESGELRKGHRIKWRGSSYLKDGKKEGVDLSGGWHDAGGNSRSQFGSVPVYLFSFPACCLLLRNEATCRSPKIGVSSVLVHGADCMGHALWRGLAEEGYL
jgi:Glycosyl hydrolase family 9